MFDIGKYMDEKFTSRAYAEKAFNDFKTLALRLNRHEKGKKTAHACYNMVFTIEETFDREFIDYVIGSRYNMAQRMKYAACRVVKDKIKIPHDVQFRYDIEAEILHAKKG